MFPIKAKQSLPIHQIVINSISIRGRLGPITVWVTKDEEAYRDEERKRLAIEQAAAASSTAVAAAASASSLSTSSPVAKKSKYNLRARFSRKSSKSTSTNQQSAVRPIVGQISMRKRDWIKIYEKEHGPSFRTYTQLDLSANPIILKPGEVRGVYIHSTLEGDEAIVYDNKHQRLTHDDPFIQILTGRAHVSEKPFGKMVSDNGVGSNERYMYFSKCAGEFDAYLSFMSSIDSNDTLSNYPRRPLLSHATLPLPFCSRYGDGATPGEMPESSSGRSPTAPSTACGIPANTYASVRDSSALPSPCLAVNVGWKVPWPVSAMTSSSTSSTC